MKSDTSARFRIAFKKLPEHIQEASHNAFNIWKNNPFHPSLNFKKIHAVESVYSVRIGISYRAIGKIVKDKIV